MSTQICEALRGVAALPIVPGAETAAPGANIRRPSLYQHIPTSRQEFEEGEAEDLLLLRGSSAEDLDALNNNPPPPLNTHHQMGGTQGIYQRQSVSGIYSGSPATIRKSSAFSQTSFAYPKSLRKCSKSHLAHQVLISGAHGGQTIILRRPTITIQEDGRILIGIKLSCDGVLRVENSFYQKPEALRSEGFTYFSLKRRKNSPNTV